MCAFHIIIAIADTLTIIYNTSVLNMSDVITSVDFYQTCYVQVIKFHTDLLPFTGAVFVILLKVSLCLNNGIMVSSPILVILRFHKTRAATDSKIDYSQCLIVRQGHE
jgi:hypothetical protein